MKTSFNEMKRNKKSKKTKKRECERVRLIKKNLEKKKKFNTKKTVCA